MLHRLFLYVQVTIDYIAQMIPCMVLVAVLFFLLKSHRMDRLAGKGFATSPCHEGGLLLFLIFCGGLAALTLFPAQFWSEIYRGELPQWLNLTSKGFYLHITVLQELTASPWRFFMFLGNMVMFLPFGVFPPLLWNRLRWYHSLLFTCAISTTIEVVQLFIGRSSDINDIIINTCGGLVGFWIYLILATIAPHFSRKFKCTEVERIHENTTED